MADYIELSYALDDIITALEMVKDDIDELSHNRRDFKAELEAIQDLIDTMRDRLNRIEPLANEQERLEADAQRRDYFRGIGPL